MGARQGAVGSDLSQELHGARAMLALEEDSEDMAAKRLNVTLVVEEDLLREARAIAAQRRTSINGLVREFLRGLVSQEGRRLAAWERIQPLLDRPSVHLNDPRPSRDELHKR